MSSALPSNKEAEAQVVASVVYDPSLFSVAEQLTADQFLDVRWRQAWQRILELSASGRQWTTADFPEVISEAAIPNSFLLEEMVQRVVEAHTFRAGMLFAQDIVRAVDEKNIERLQNLVERTSLPIASRGQSVSAADIAGQYIETIGKPRRRYDCGFTALDRHDLLEPGYLVVLCARPGQGKSLLVHQIGDSFSKTYPDKHVVICSPEMSAIQVVGRMAQARAGISRDATVDSEELQDRLRHSSREAQRQLGNVHIFDGAVSSLDLHMQCRSIARREGPVGLIITDHLRLLADRGDEERHRLGRMTFRHKEMAREFDCPVLLVCQLNRAVEAREGKRPALQDLRDSGEIEESTDKVVSLYREGYYADPGQDRSGMAELGCLKNRDGPQWFAKLHFSATDGPRFSDIQYGPTIAERPDVQEEIPF